MQKAPAEVTYAYKSNPEKYETEEARITLPVIEGMNAVTTTKAARAMVRKTLGLKTAKSDRAAAVKYLKLTAGEDASLDDIGPG